MTTLHPVTRRVALLGAGSVLLAGCTSTPEEHTDAAEEPAGEHGQGHGEGHDHPMDGGAPPAGIAEASDPTYPVGAEVTLAADHMAGMDGATATVTGAFETTTYAVSFTPVGGGDPVTDHRWVVHEELEDPGAAPLADGTEVVITAEHMEGMNGAAGSIDSSTQETVYMVDYEADGMTMTNHKWVVESEIAPAG